MSVIERWFGGFTVSMVEYSTVVLLWGLEVRRTVAMICSVSPCSKVLVFGTNYSRRVQIRQATIATSHFTISREANEESLYNDNIFLL